MRFNPPLRCILLSGHTSAVAPNPRFHRTCSCSLPGRVFDLLLDSNSRLSPPLFILLPLDSCLFFFSYFYPRRGFQSLRLHPVSLSSPSLAPHGSRLVSRERWIGVDIVGHRKDLRSNKVGLVCDASLLTPSLGMEQWPTWYALATTPCQTPHMQTAATNFPMLTFVHRCTATGSEITGQYAYTPTHRPVRTLHTHTHTHIKYSLFSKKD